MTDDQLENLLERQGESWRAAQPATPPLSALSPQSASPSAPASAPASRTGDARSPWLLPALVAAALLVPILATFILLRGDLRGDGPDRARNPVAASPTAPASPAAPVLVPWVDSSSTAVPLPLGPDRLTIRAGAEGPLPEGTQQCESGDFGEPSAVAMPGIYSGRYTLTVQRVGAEGCVIGNTSPRVYLRDSSGQTLGEGGDSLLMGYTGYTLLQPGDLLMVPAGICGTGIASLELRFASAPVVPRLYGQREDVSVAIPFTGPSTCASGGRAGTSHQLAVPRGSLNSLVQIYSVPSRVRSGQSLDYTVTLTNPSATAVSLDPCPSYRQSLTDVVELPDNQGATSTGLLNCAAAPASVPAHGSIIFEMRLDTSGVPAGDRRLVWNWLGSNLTDGQGYAQFPTVTVY